MPPDAGRTWSRRQHNPTAVVQRFIFPIANRMCVKLTQTCLKLAVKLVVELVVELVVVAISSSSRHRIQNNEEQ